MEPDSDTTKAGFWRRIAAGWIDAFVIFVLTNFMIAFLVLLHFRISFGTLFVITGAVYSSVLLSLYSQTPGKMIMKVFIEGGCGEPVSKRSIVLREVFGKWGVTLALPMMLAVILGGRTYIPTFTDIIYLTPAAIFSVIWYLFTKQMWYDRMAGLKAEYHRERMVMAVQDVPAMARGARFPNLRLRQPERGRQALDAHGVPRRCGETAL